MSEWISVKDQLPREDWLILVYKKSDLPAYVCDLGRVMNKEFYSVGGIVYPLKNITHWMFLPEPPND